MSTSIYPSWRYHRNGKSMLVHHPDHEPQGSDWSATPFRQPALEPKLPECCQKLKDKFDVAWKELLADHKALQKTHADALAQFEVQWDAKVQENIDLQDQWTEKYAALKAKHDALLSAAIAEVGPEKPQQPTEPASDSTDAPAASPEATGKASKKPAKK